MFTSLPAQVSPVTGATGREAVCFRVSVEFYILHVNVKRTFWVLEHIIASQRESFTS